VGKLAGVCHQTIEGVVTLKGLRRNYLDFGKCEDKVHCDRVEQPGNYTNRLKLAVWLGTEGGVNETT